MEKDAIEERERQEEAAQEKKMKEEADQRMKEEEAAGLVGKEESTADKQLEADVEEVFFNFYYWHTIISYVFPNLMLFKCRLWPVFFVHVLLRVCSSLGSQLRFMGSLIFDVLKSTWLIDVMIFTAGQSWWCFWARSYC